MNSDQARMARAYVQLGVREVAALANVTPNTISRIENGGDAKASTLDALRHVYEMRGVHFLSPGDTASGLGIALRSRE